MSGGISIRVETNWGQMSDRGNVSQVAAVQRSRGLGRSLTLAAAAVVIVIGAVAFFGLGNSGPPALEISSVSEIADLSGTLSPQDSGRRLADARACKVPLAHVQLWHEGAAPDSVVQVRSGDYVSPPFRVTTTPERIAVPFPAPYPTGSGDISVVGTAQGIAISLHPTVQFANVNGLASIHVSWKPGNPCQ